MNIRTHDLFQFFDDGQRAFRLKKLIKDCPKFNLTIYTSAWKAGYYSARDNFGLKDGFQNFLRNLDNA